MDKYYLINNLIPISSNADLKTIRYSLRNYYQINVKKIIEISKKEFDICLNEYYLKIEKCKL